MKKIVLTEEQLREYISSRIEEDPELKKASTGAIEIKLGADEDIDKLYKRIIANPKIMSFHGISVIDAEDGWKRIVCSDKYEFMKLYQLFVGKQKGEDVVRYIHNAQ